MGSREWCLETSGSVRPMRHAVVIGLTLTVLGSCAPVVRVTPPPADAPAEEVALSGASVMIGAGDIASCDGRGDDSTAAIVDSVLKADSAAGVENAVFTLGDNVYPEGTTVTFQRCFGPSWGDTAKRIMQWIRPAMGNHDLAGGGDAYFSYFGDRAGERHKGYYAYAIGEWRAIVLNSEIVDNARFSVEDAEAQEDWLRVALRDEVRKCTIAYLHRPLWSSGAHGGHGGMAGIVRLLQEAGVELVLAGHDHHYERFAPMTSAGALDSTAGITQIIVGTGGADLRGLRTPLARHSVTRIQGHHGVLKLTLGAGAWRSAFIDVRGRVWDRSAGECH